MKHHADSRVDQPGVAALLLDLDFVRKLLAVDVDAHVGPPSLIFVARFDHAAFILDNWHAADGERLTAFGALHLPPFIFLRVPVVACLETMRAAETAALGIGVSRINIQIHCGLSFGFARLWTRPISR